MPIKILVVEDNLDSRDLLHFLLTSQEHEVKTAVDGAEGLYMAKAERPDLIITDLGMPNVDGSQMIKEIRLTPELTDIPIVVYTGFFAQTMETAIKNAVNRTFIKPTDMESLLEFVQEINLLKHD